MRLTEQAFCAQQGAKTTAFGQVFGCTDAEYQKRKALFDFASSDSDTQLLIDDIDFLKKYLADYLSDSTYVHILEYIKVKKKNRITVQLTNSSPDVKLLIIDRHKNWLLYETSQWDKIGLEKNRDFTLIGIKSVNGKILVSMSDVFADSDKVIDLNFKEYFKKEFL